MLFFLKSPEEKIEILFESIGRDPFFTSILGDLKEYGCEISFSFWGRPGLYIPQILRVGVEQDIAQCYDAAAQQAKAKMHFTDRMGQGAAIFTFMHELMHFYQDTRGLYRFALQIERRFPIQLDLYSSVVANNFCEAWAVAQSVATAWHFKQFFGDNRAWIGAKLSPDWKDCAKVYAREMGISGDKKQAIANVISAWYAGKHRAFYERHAMSIWQREFDRQTKPYKDLDKGKLCASLRHCGLPEILSVLKMSEWPDFIGLVNPKTPLYNNIHDHQVRQEIRKFEKTYGAPEKGDVVDIRCGSLPFIWYKRREMQAQSV